MFTDRVIESIAYTRDLMVEIATIAGICFVVGEVIIFAILLAGPVR
jgi:hypothetical protein